MGAVTVHVDPRTATPCRTVAFSTDGSLVVEANYLGFITLRDALTGDLRRRFLAQTALVETVRFEDRTGDLLLVGAGFEGGRDCGVAKIIEPLSGRRLFELRGHADDATDVMSLPGERRRVVSVGLDRRVVVHDVADPARTWAWSGYEDYLNTCATRPRHDGQLAITGDSPFSYVLDADAREVLAKLDTPGDTNGLCWSEDGRYLVVADDLGRVVYFDGDAAWRLAGEARVGGAAKRMVVDPAAPARALVACYDGRVWSVSRSPGGAPPRVAVERRRGLWGINVAATATRLAVPSFFDRAYLIARTAGASGELDAGADIGPEPRPTYGCNWVALHPSRDEIAITHDDGRVRVRDARSGALLRALGPDTDSLYMGAAFHPTLPRLATVDFYGELLVYESDSGRVLWRRDPRLRPGDLRRLEPLRALPRRGRLPVARARAADRRRRPARRRAGARRAQPRRGEEPGLRRIDAAAGGVRRRRPRGARSRGRSLRRDAIPPRGAAHGAFQRRRRLAGRARRLRGLARSVAARLRSGVRRGDRPGPRARARREDGPRLGVRPPRGDRLLRSHRDALVRRHPRRRIAPGAALQLRRLRRALPPRPRLRVLVRRGGRRPSTRAPGSSCGTGRRRT